MKNNFRILFRLLILMLAIPFFSDCEKDDLHEEQAQPVAFFKTFSDFPELAGLYKKSVTDKTKELKSKTSNSTDNSLYDFSIDRSKVLKAIGDNNGYDYSMRIFRELNN